MFQRLVVSLDGSAMSERALAAASHLGLSLNLPIAIVHVIESSAIQQGSVFSLGKIDETVFAETRRRLQSEVEQYLGPIAERLQADGLSTETLVVVDRQAAEGILGVVRGGDMLVLSSHGRTGFSKWLIGSVAEEITKRSPVSVLLIRSQETSP